MTYQRGMLYSTIAFNLRKTDLKIKMSGNKHRTPNSLGHVSGRRLVSYQKHSVGLSLQLSSFEKWMVNDKIIPNTHNTES